MSNLEARKRYEWVDVMRFLGIFAIYVGHFGNSAGKLYPFVFKYHVPLFFLVSGFFAVRSESFSFLQSLKKRACNLLIPYFGFCIISIVVAILSGNLGAKLTLTYLIEALLGIRNTLAFAPALWFLPALFVVSVFYDAFYALLKRFSGFIIFMLIISIAMFVCTRTVFPALEVTIPTWFFNIDSAMYYFIYYMIGAAIFPFISKIKLYNIM